MEQEKVSNAAAVMNRTVCLCVEVHTLGSVRSAGPKALRQGVDPKQVKAAKKIFDSATYHKITTLDGVMSNWLRDQCLPTPLKKGIYLLPLAAREGVEKALAEYKQQRQNVLVPQFVSEYPALIQDARERFEPQGLFDPKNYPAVESVASYFGVEWYQFDFKVPGSLADVSDQAFAAEQAKHANLWDEAISLARQVLRENLKDLVDHAVDKLGTTADGKKKVFRNSFDKNWVGFLTAFDARNITDDKELQSLVDKAKSLLNGADNDSLRSDESLRNKVRAGFEEVKAVLDTMVINAPLRVINLDADEA